MVTLKPTPKLVPPSSRSGKPDGAARGCLLGKALDHQCLCTSFQTHTTTSYIVGSLASSPVHPRPLPFASSTTAVSRSNIPPKDHRCSCRHVTTPNYSCHYSLPNARPKYRSQMVGDCSSMSRSIGCRYVGDLGRVHCISTVQHGGSTTTSSSGSRYTISI